jgi:hypothetical protein
MGAVAFEEAELADRDGLGGRQVEHFTAAGQALTAPGVGAGGAGGVGGGADLGRDGAGPPVVGGAARFLRGGWAVGAGWAGLTNGGGRFQLLQGGHAGLQLGDQAGGGRQLRPERGVFGQQDLSFLLRHRAIVAGLRALCLESEQLHTHHAPRTTHHAPRNIRRRLEFAGN